MLVTYSPAMQSDFDSAWMTLTLSEGAPVVVTVQGQGLQSGLEITPVPLGFAFVEVGQSVTRALHLTSIGNVPVTIPPLSIVNDEIPPGFALANGSWSGGEIAPGETQEIEITFSPTQGTRYDAQLISGDAGFGPPLVGYGASPMLWCTPPSLDFGTVATDSSTTLPIICTYLGTDAPGQMEFTILALSIDNPAFTASISPGPPLGLTSGESVLIDVVCSPSSSHDGIGTLTIVTDPPIGDAGIIALHGC